MLPADVKRNFKLGVANGMLFTLGETLLDPTLVLVIFLSHLTQSPIFLGLVLPIRDGLWALPQLWVSGYLQGQPRKLPLYRKMSIVRVCSWALILASIAIIRNPTWSLITFFIAYTTAGLASGISGLPFMEVVAKTIPSRRVGEFFAWRFGLGGLLGISGSLLVRFLLNESNPVTFPYNFGLLAAGYLILGSISQYCFNIVREPVSPQVTPPATLGTQLRQVPGLLKNNLNFSKFITMEAMVTLASSATPFFAVYFQQKLGVPTSMLGIYLAVYTVTILLSNLVFGKISLKSGNRLVILLATGAGCCMSLLVLALVFLSHSTNIYGLTASFSLAPAFLLSGLRVTGVGIANNALLLGLAPPEQRSIYLGVNNSIVGMVTLATGFSGLVMALFGFETLLGITVFAHISAFALAFSLINIHQADQPVFSETIPPALAGE